MRLDPKQIGGLKYAITVAPTESDLSSIAENKSAFVMRVKDDQQVYTLVPIFQGGVQHFFHMIQHKGLLY